MDSCTRPLFRQYPLGQHSGTIAANPALITQATTGSLAWVRAGFQPQVSAFRTTYSGDSSAADANGTAWTGQQSIGALASRLTASPAALLLGGM